MTREDAHTVHCQLILKGFRHGKKYPRHCLHGADAYTTGLGDAAQFPPMSDADCASSPDESDAESVELVSPSTGFLTGSLLFEPDAAAASDPSGLSSRTAAARRASPEMVCGCAGLAEFRARARCSRTGSAVMRRFFLACSPPYERITYPSYAPARRQQLQSYKLVIIAQGIFEI